MFPIFVIRQNCELFTINHNEGNYYLVVRGFREGIDRFNHILTLNHFMSKVKFSLNTTKILTHILLDIFGNRREKGDENLKIWFMGIRQRFGPISFTFSISLKHALENIS